MESLTVVELRRYVRDLFALASLPALWRRTDVKHMTESLADAVFRALDAELVHVVIPGPDGDHASLRSAGGHTCDPEALRALIPVVREGSPAQLELNGTKMNVIRKPIELPAGEAGRIVVAA